jgi:hypothetical protein
MNIRSLFSIKRVRPSVSKCEQDENGCERVNDVAVPIRSGQILKKKFCFILGNEKAWTNNCYLFIPARYFCNSLKIKDLLRISEVPLVICHNCRILICPNRIVSILNFSNKLHSKIHIKIF